MKLEKVLSNLNSFEKNAFLKIIDSILAKEPKNATAINLVLSDSSRDLKNMDNINVVKVFALVEEEFMEYIRCEFARSASQLDILVDIISRDGNSIIKQDWFARLYESELHSFESKLHAFKTGMTAEKSELSAQRLRDYNIYLQCLRTAYHNDEVNNLDLRVTDDEQSILGTLASVLALSQEEVKLIKYQVLPVRRMPIDDVINELRAIGVIFYSKKNNVVYVADEMVRLLRLLRGKEVADKFFRRVLRCFREPLINQICKQHRIDWRLPLDAKIKEIINEGVSFTGVLVNDVHKEGTTLSDKKKFINEICDTGLKINPPLKGVLIEEKIDNLIKYFDEVERDERVGISLDGYDKLLRELVEVLPGIPDQLRQVFELQEERIMNSGYLLDYNIKPRDILELLEHVELTKFCEAKSIRTRGDLIANILEAYKDSENLYLENYENIGLRNLAGLKENGIVIKESELGVKFEDLTKKLFDVLGFNVDEDFRKKLNTSKDNIDIVLNLGNNDLILVECKTVKESGYNKFSSVSRQLKAYVNLAKHNDFRVVKFLLVAPEFSDEFVKDCGLEYELNLSLITASTLKKIAEGFKLTKHKKFPHNLLLRDVLIQEDRVLKAIER
ncbi:MAG: hypothetical protein WBB32_16990 [Flavobacteriales bacterium]